MGTIKVKRGEKSRLPQSASLGELLYCTDTNELYVGQGEGFDLKVLANINEIIEARGSTRSLAERINSSDSKVGDIVSQRYYSLFDREYDGFNIYTPYNVDEFGDYKSLVEFAHSCGSNMINVCVRMTMPTTSSDTLNMSTKQSDLILLVDYIRSKGMKVAIKPHINYNSNIVTDNVSDLSRWLNSYKSNILELLSWIPDKFSMVYISNELSTITSSNEEFWKIFITELRAGYPGVQITSSSTLGELLTNITYKYLDIIGVNCYIGVYGDSSSSTTELKFNLFHDYDNDRNYFEIMSTISQYYCKDILISEVGILPTWDHFKSPSDISKPAVVDLSAQTKYYEIMLESLSKIKYVRGIQLWSLSDGFSPKDNYECVLLIKKYFGGECNV